MVDDIGTGNPLFAVVGPLPVGGISYSSNRCLLGHHVSPTVASSSEPNLTCIDMNTHHGVCITYTLLSYTLISLVVCLQLVSCSKVGGL